MFFLRCMACSGRTSSAILLSSRDQISLHYTKLPGPTWLQPSHAPLHSQRKSFNNRTILILYHSKLTLPCISLPGCCHYIIEMFALLDWQTLNLLFIFILSGAKEHDHMILVRFVWNVWTSSSSSLHLNSIHWGYQHSACLQSQAIPLGFGSRTGEGHSMQILNVATLQKLWSFRTLIIHGDMTRHGQNLITHTSATWRAGDPSVLPN